MISKFCTGEVNRHTARLEFCGDSVEVNGLIAKQTGRQMRNTDQTADTTGGLGVLLLGRLQITSKLCSFRRFGIVAGARARARCLSAVCNWLRFLSLQEARAENRFDARRKWSLLQSAVDVLGGGCFGRNYTKTSATFYFLLLFSFNVSAVFFSFCFPSLFRKVKTTPHHPSPQKKKIT